MLPTSEDAVATNAKPHENRGASQGRHIAVASFRCVTATCAGDHRRQGSPVLDVIDRGTSLREFMDRSRYSPTSNQTAAPDYAPKRSLFLDLEQHLRCRGGLDPSLGARSTGRRCLRVKGT